MVEEEAEVTRGLVAQAKSSIKASGWRGRGLLVTPRKHGPRLHAEPLLPLEALQTARRFQEGRVLLQQRDHQFAEQDLTWRERVRCSGRHLLHMK